MLVVFVALFTYYWVKYDRIVEARIRGPIFSTSAQIYARPPLVSAGDKIQVEGDRFRIAPCWLFR